MCKALDSNIDREEAIISLPEDKRIRNFRNEILEDYSTEEAEYKYRLFPICKVFPGAGGLPAWRRGSSRDPEKQIPITTNWAE